MVRRYARRLVAIALTAPLLLGVAAAGSGAEKPVQSTLTLADCVKCHAGPSADIASDGGAHRTITCLACHPGHRPASKNNIPACTQCHTGKPHYNLKGCLGCHKNPHTPLKVSFGYSVTDPCLTCHTAQIKQLREHRSKHSNLFCSSCHNLHRIVPLCVQCHKPHAATMTQADCRKCHKAHMPSVVTYGNDLPNGECAACHQKAATLLAATKAKHGSLSCVTCHAGKHRTIPSCQSCHGVPHPAAMVAKFPKCGDCHYIAHDLNNWPKDAPKADAR
jgi:hypothetical protein